MTREELIIKQALPLDLKIEMTKRRIREFVGEFGINKVYISFSGGKDSTVLACLARELYPDIKLVFSNTGMEFPEIVKFVKKKQAEGWNIDIVQPIEKFKDIVEKYGYPVITKKQSYYIYQYRNSNSEYIKNLRWNGSEKGNFKIAEKWKHLVNAPFKIHDICCKKLKKDPFTKYEKATKRLPIIGTMAIESTGRTESYLKTGCNTFEEGKEKSRPLSIWTEKNILEYI